MNIYLFIVFIYAGVHAARNDTKHEHQNFSTSMLENVITISTTASTTTKPKLINLQISGKNNITLPTNDLTLIAKGPDLNISLTWKWSVLNPLVIDPKENVQMEGLNSRRLHLSNLIAGDYVFEVEAHSDKNNIHGRERFNLTVNAAPVINRPPTAVITAPSMIVIPPKKVFLSGEDSYDPDDSEDVSDIVAYKWAIKKGSMDEEKFMEDIPTDKEVLELELSHPGNITFVLTVTDTAGNQGMTEAKVVVQKKADEPPTANAGDAVSINLPTDQVVLCGNSSTDDNGIVEYQWRASQDNKKMTDTIGVHEKCLTVSGIKYAGIYTFVLKVLDIKKQWDEASVQIVVNEPTNVAPVVLLKSDSLYRNHDVLTFFISNDGQNSILRLDGCNSSDENSDKLTYVFTQENTDDGQLDMLSITPTSDECSVDVGEIKTEGEYNFKLTVTDTGNPPLSSSAVIDIVVKSALPPKINVETDLKTYTSKRYLAIDASNSFSYDHSNLTFNWAIADESLSTFGILNNSNHKKKLEIINFESGLYMFNLTITDGQEQTSYEMVRVLVTESENMQYIFEIRITDCYEINNRETTNVKEELLIDLKSIGAESVYIVDLYHDHANSDLIILALAYSLNSQLIPNEEILPVLIDAFKYSGFNTFCKSSIPTVKSYICLSKCSGHGTCNNGTNVCQCDPFWMPSPFDYETNCAWSVVYFCLTLIVFVALLVISGFSFKSVYMRKLKKTQKQKNRKSRSTYKQLNNQSDSDNNFEEFHRVRRKKRRKLRENTKFTNVHTDEESSNTLLDTSQVNEHFF